MSIEEMKRERIGWIDIAKIIGMFAIYLGHFFSKAGLSHAFVFSFHVPLFFFLAGCTETMSKQSSFSEYVLKKARTVLLPWFCFSLISTLVYILMNDSSMHEIKELLVRICEGGIRMTSVAPALWFLSGLFVLQVLFCIIKRLKYPAIIIPLALGLHLFAKTIVCNSGEQVRQSPVILHLFNWDWACLYLIYFVIGFYSFSAINNWFKLYKGWRIHVFRISLVITTIVALLVFEQKDYITAMLSGHNKLLIDLWVMARTLILILFILLISKVLEGVKWLEYAGSQSLYLCGNEWLAKQIISSLIGLFGLEITFNDPFVVYVYVAILIFVVIRLFVPIEKEIAKAITL